MNSYEDIWANDGRRQAAMRGANRRYPDLTPPPISTRRFTWMTLLGLIVLVGLAVLAITFA